MTELGRWVEARDLKKGDVLHRKNGEGLAITGLLSQHEKAEVYNLTVESCHNYAVHQIGILVHNKGGKPVADRLVTVYGRVLLEHYEVSILGADDASHIMNWLQENAYNVNPSARDVLDAYIDQNWAFVAVKLNPGEKRHYENEFLPPLAIRYRHGRLILPLHISSVSTRRNARITLYVIAESMVTSYNYPTATLKYEDYLSEWVVPEIYVEASILGTMAGKGRGLVVMWSGEFARSTDRQEIFDRLNESSVPGRRKEVPDAP